jgi:HEAT repeat protein
MTRRRRGASVVVGLVSSFVLVGLGSSARAATVFKLADDSTVVARGVVGRVQPYKNEAFLVFTITPTEILKGGAVRGTPLELVQERVFGTEKPYFATGSEVLVFAVPLPPYSYYRESLPPGSYLRWTDPKDSAGDIATLADPAVGEAVQRYLAVAKDRAASARQLTGLLASPVAQLRADALTTIADRPQLGATLDAAALEPVRLVLADEHVPVAERGAIIVTLARAGARGIIPIAEDMAAKRGPLQAPALDALVLMGHAPREEQLLAASHGEDPALRIAAVRGLARSSSRAAFERVAEIVRGDPVPEVRKAALTALGSAHDPRAVGILADAMRSSDKGEVLAAGESLGRIASPEAIRALGVVLREGSFDAEAAAAFALNQTNKPEAYAILRDQRELHPDPQVRRLIKLALGEHLEEHDD